MSEHIVDVGKRHIKEINEEIQEAATPIQKNNNEGETH